MLIDFVYALTLNNICKLCSSLDLIIHSSIINFFSELSIFFRRTVKYFWWNPSDLHVVSVCFINQLQSLISFFNSLLRNSRSWFLFLLLLQGLKLDSFNFNWFVFIFERFLGILKTLINLSFSLLFLP